MICELAYSIGNRQAQYVFDKGLYHCFLDKLIFCVTCRMNSHRVLPAKPSAVETLSQFADFNLPSTGTTQWHFLSTQRTHNSM